MVVTQTAWPPSDSGASHVSAAGREVAELVRVADDVDRADAAGDDVEGEGVLHDAVQEHEQAGLAVDGDGACLHPRDEARPDAEEEAGDVVGSKNGAAGG